MATMVQAVPPFPLAGEMASLGAAFVWATSISLFARFGRGIPAGALNLFKNLVAVSCFAVALLALGPKLPSDPATWLTLVASGIIGLAIGDTAFFATLERLGAQATSASQCMAPPFAALIATFFLGESLNLGETAGLVLTATAVAAVIFFAKRGNAHLATVAPRTLAVGLVFATVAALCQAIAVVTSRHALQNADVLNGTAIRIAPAILVLIGMAIVRRQGLPLAHLRVSRTRLWLLVLASTGGTFLGLLLMSTGAKYAKAGVSSALTSTYPLWIIPLARFFLGEKTNWQVMALTVVAVAGIGIMVIAR